MNSYPPNFFPPNFIPSKNTLYSHTYNLIFQSDPEKLKYYIFKCIYMWLRDKTQFWCYLTFVGGGHAGGWLWNGKEWLNFEIDFRKLDCFIV